MRVPLGQHQRQFVAPPRDACLAGESACQVQQGLRRAADTRGCDARKRTREERS